MSVVEEKAFDTSGAGATAFIIGNDSYDECATCFPDTEGSLDDGSLANFVVPAESKGV